MHGRRWSYSTAGAQTTLISCARMGPDASDIKRTLFVPSYPGSALKEVDVAFTSTNVTGFYPVNMTVEVNGALAGTIRLVTVNITALRQSVPAAFVLPTAIPIARGSNVRFVVQVVAGPVIDKDTGELSWEGVDDSNCPAYPTNPGSTAQIGSFKTPVQVIGAS